MSFRLIVVGDFQQKLRNHCLICMAEVTEHIVFTITVTYYSKSALAECGHVAVMGPSNLCPYMEPQNNRGPGLQPCA
jgi:hypothetical protein